LCVAKKTHQQWTVGANIVDRFQYTHDRLGNRIARSQFWDADTAVNESYAYDGLQQRNCPANHTCRRAAIF
jgi:hypothetical protein